MIWSVAAGKSSMAVIKDLESEIGQVKRRTDGFFRTATVYPLSTKALRGHAVLGLPASAPGI
jgi:hypothetical protein